MRLHRFFIAADLAPHKAGGIFLIEDAGVNHQLADVLRAKGGDPIQLFDRAGNQITGTIQTVKKSGTDMLIDLAETHRAPEKRTTLYLAMLKRENFELAAQKATEVGITDIVPLLTERTIKTGFNRARLEKILIEATEQSGRRTIPAISEPMQFETAIKTTHDMKVFLDLDGEPLNTKVINKKNVGIFVGPEGGWTDKERTVAGEARCAITTVSEHTLRAETAAIVGSYLII